MNRRNFLKTLTSIGLVAVASPVLATIPKFKDYPSFTYGRDWVIEKRTFLHYVSAIGENETFGSYYYLDDEMIPDDLLEEMFMEVYKALEK